MSKMLVDVDTQTAVEPGVRPCAPARDDRIVNRSTARPLPTDFICISRMVGTGGDEIAIEAARRLHWPLYDRETLAVLSGDDDRVGRRNVLLNELERHWCDNHLRPLLDARCSHVGYVARLTETVRALAARGPAVFVGRGCDAILPRDRGLRVRIVASLDARVRRYCRDHNLTAAEARWEIERLNARCADFVREYFGGCVDDPSRFDLIINTDQTTLEHAVELLLAARLAALRQR